MRTSGVISAIVAVMLGVLAGAGSAQTTTTVEQRKFEVLSVDGNNLVVRNPDGTHEYNVPDDFRFTVDGKKLSVKELKPGMKGTAIVTTKTTVTPVTVTEIREGVVVDATDHSVIVRGNDGIKRFTQPQLDDRGLQMLKDGKIVRIRDLRKGDVVTATVISKTPPEVMTETEVQATLAKSTPTAASSAAPASAPAASASAQPATPPPPAVAPDAASTSASRPQAAEGSTPWLWYVVAAIVIAIGWFFLAGRKASR